MNIDILRRELKQQRIGTGVDWRKGKKAIFVERLLAGRFVDFVKQACFVDQHGDAGERCVWVFLIKHAAFEASSIRHPINRNCHA